MKCSFCGNEVDGDMKFCPTCGAEMNFENSENQEQPAPQYEDPNGSNDYSYGEPAGSQPDYGYGQPGNDPNSYGQTGGGYGYGQPYNGQPGNPYGQQEKPISGTPYLIFSILTTLCCCLPLGIAGIVFSSKINSLQRMGDYEGAKAAAKKAKILIIVGAVGGLLTSVIVGMSGVMDSLYDSGMTSSILSDDSDSEEEEYTDDADDEDTEDKAEEPAAPAEAKGELGDTWDSFSVQINESVLNFPCAIAEVEAAGLTLDTDDTPEDFVINKEDYELVFFDDENDNSIMFVVANNTDSAKTVKECTVNGIYVDEYDVEDGNLTIIFPGGVQIGTDISEVIEKWGDSDDVYEGEYSDSYSWYEGGSFNYCTLNVDPDTNKVTMIDLDGQELK